MNAKSRQNAEIWNETLSQINFMEVPNTVPNISINIWMGQLALTITGFTKAENLIRCIENDNWFWETGATAFRNFPNIEAKVKMA